MQQILKSQQKMKILSATPIPRSHDKKQRIACYYKILETPKLPSLGPKTNRSAIIGPSNSPQKTAQNIVKNRQFIYIDINQQSGCKAMQRYDNIPQRNTNKKMSVSMTASTYMEDELQKIGNNYVGQLKNLSQQNQHAYQYFQKTKQLSEQRNQIRKIVNLQLDQSLKKMKLRKNYKPDYAGMAPKRHEQYDPNKLRQLLQKQQLQTINHEIWKKQKRLIDKFGIGQHYLPHNSTNRGIDKTIKMRKYKSKLPELDYRTIQ